MPGVAERLEDAHEHVLHRLLVRRERDALEELRLDPLDDVGSEVLHQALAASEVVEDGRVRDAEIARDVLEADRLRAALPKPLGGGVEDGGAGFRGAPARPGHGPKATPAAGLTTYLHNCKYWACAWRFP